MDVRPWSAAVSLPPPPPFPPPLLPAPPPPPYGFVIPRQPGPPPVSLPAPAVPARRRYWVGWVAAATATFAIAVPALFSAPQHAVSNAADLHAVAGTSQQPWSAEFVDDSGLPARWDPCVPIRYVVDYTGAPPGAQSDVQQAISRLAQATGMTFVADGLSAERPMRGRSAYQPGVYGKSWAPLLIAWSSPAGTDLLDDPKAEAVTVPIAVPSLAGTGGGSIVSAEVVLNTDRQLAVGFGPGPSEGEVLMHELGHVVGLGHVASSNEAMFPSVRGVAAYGPGDLAGFAAVGLPAGCHAAPAAHALDVLPPAQG